MTPPLITLTDPRAAAAEAYRSLYINLNFSSQEKPLRRLLVSAAGPEGSNSVVLANLAVVAAQMGQRVLVLDSDLRQPQQHELFGLRNERGLTTATADKEAAAGALQAVPGVEGLAVLTSGPLPASPSQVLANRRFDELLAELAEQVDLILLDAPPITAVADASVLASKVDGVLLVLNAGQSKRDQARQAKETLDKLHAHVVGVVLNNT